MKSIKAVTLALALTVGIGAAGSAQAAECHLRNINFVSTVNDGRLVVNSEMWNYTASTGWTFVGQLANSTYCKMDGSMNGISGQTCKNWYQLALTAMLTNKKVYVTAASCIAGNGVNLSSVGYFGLNH